MTFPLMQVFRVSFFGNCPLCTRRYNSHTFLSPYVLLNAALCRYSMLVSTGIILLRSLGVPAYFLNKGCTSFSSSSSVAFSSFASHNRADVNEKCRRLLTFDVSFRWLTKLFTKTVRSTFVVKVFVKNWIFFAIVNLNIMTNSLITTIHEIL